MLSTFERVLVAMDLSPMDAHLLRAVATLESYLGMKKVYFLNIMPDFTLPKNAGVEFHKLFTSEYPVDEKVRDKMVLDIQAIIGERPELDLQVEVIEGRPYQKLLHWIQVKDIELLVTGHKKISQGSGITARRVARNSPCNVLFVPETTVPEPRTILVPVDFSECSARALRTAISLSRQLPDSLVKVLYVVDLPPADYYMRPFEGNGFRGLLRESAASSLNRFLEDNNIDQAEIDLSLIDNTYSNIAIHIHEFALTAKADLVVIGAQGHSSFENFLFGSVTEKLVDRNTDLPILIIR